MPLADELRAEIDRCLGIPRSGRDLNTVLDELMAINRDIDSAEYALSSGLEDAMRHWLNVLKGWQS